MARKQVMHGDLERSVSELEELLKQSEYCVDAVVVASSLIPTNLVPSNVGSERLAAECVHVPARKSFVRSTYYVPVTSSRHRNAPP